MRATLSFSMLFSMFLIAMSSGISVKATGGTLAALRQEPGRKGFFQHYIKEKIFRPFLHKKPAVVVTRDSDDSLQAEVTEPFTYTHPNLQYLRTASQSNIDLPGPLAVHVNDGRWVCEVDTDRATQLADFSLPYQPIDPVFPGKPFDSDILFDEDDEGETEGMPEDMLAMYRPSMALTDGSSILYLVLQGNGAQLYPQRSVPRSKRTRMIF